MCQFYYVLVFVWVHVVNLRFRILFTGNQIESDYTQACGQETSILM